MHDASYTKKIKALLAAREELTLNLNSCVYQFRNGRKPYAENVEQAKEAFKEALAILEEASPGEKFDTPERRKEWLQSFGKDARREQAIKQAQEEDKQH